MRDNSQTPTLRSVDVVANITKDLEAAKFTEAQVCRSCVFQDKKFTGDIAELQLAKAEGTKDAYVAKHSCAPTKYASNGLQIVGADGTISSFKDGEVVTSIGRKPSRAAALAETCGQTIPAKCADCGHFRAQRVSIEGDKNFNGSPRNTWISVGGHCGLVDRCSPVPRGVDTTSIQNCSTCANQQSFTNDWQLEHGTVVEMDLLNYAKHQVTSKAEPSQRGLEIWRARKQLGTVRAKIGPNMAIYSDAPWGTLFSFKGYVLDVEYGEIVTRKMIPSTSTPLSVKGDTDPMFSARAAFKLWGQYCHDTVWEFLARWSATHDMTPVVADEPTVVAPSAGEVLTRRKVITRWLVEFRTDGGGVCAWIDAANSDYTIGVVTPLPDASKVMVTIQSPWHRRYGLSEPQTKIVRQLPHSGECVCRVDTSWWSMWADKNSADWHTHPETNPDCQRCGGSGTVYAISPKTTQQMTLRGEPTCVRCKSWQPCYYHTKNFGRTIDPVTGEIAVKSTIYDDVDAQINDGVWLGIERGLYLRFDNQTQLIRKISATNPESNPERILSVSSHGIVTNADGGEPEIGMFRVWLRSLLDNHPRHAESIRHQFLEAWGSLPRAKMMRRGNLVDKTVAIDHNFGRPLSVQPWAPYCSAYLTDPSLGIDMRAALGDNWGDPRSNQGTNPMVRYTDQNYFSWKKFLALQEYLRVTNPGERLQEVMSSSQRHQRELSVGVYKDADWENFTVKKRHVYDVAGVLDGDTTIASYRKWLDSERTIELRDAVGDVETFRASNRYLQFGYENFRGGRQLIKEDVAPVWETRPAEDMEQSDLSVYVGFLCTLCGTKWNIDEGIDKDLVCDYIDPDDKDAIENNDTCGGSIVWYQTARNADYIMTEMNANQIAPVDPYRRKLDDTMTVAADNAAWQQTEMLMQLGHYCPQWRPRGRVGQNWRYRTQVTPSVEQSEWLGKKVVYVMGGYPHTPEQVAEFHDTGKRNLCPQCTREETIEAKHFDNLAAYPLIRAIVFSNGANIVTFMAPAGPQIVEILSID